MIQYDTIWYNMIQYDTIWYNMIQYDTIWYNILQYDKIYSYNWNYHIAVANFIEDVALGWDLKIYILSIEKGWKTICTVIVVGCS
jgi:hypothetical protein